LLTNRTPYKKSEKNGEKTRKREISRDIATLATFSLSDFRTQTQRLSHANDFGDFQKGWRLSEAREITEKPGAAASGLLFSGVSAAVWGRIGGAFSRLGGIVRHIDAHRAILSYLWRVLLRW
jgi:hypothetical protein